MSEHTKANLEAALQAHIADENDNDLAVAWVVVTECASGETFERDGYFYVEGADGQSRFTGDGLLYAALHRD